MADNTTIDFVLALEDQVSDPAQRMANTFKNLERAALYSANSLKSIEDKLSRTASKAREAKGELDQIKTTLGKLQTAGAGVNLDNIFGGGKGPMLTLDLVSLASNAAMAFVDIIKTGLQTVWDIGKYALKQAAQEERTGVSFELILGSKEKAAEYMDYITRHANSRFSAFTEDELKGASIPAVNAGFRGEDFKNILLGGSAVEAKLGGGIGKVKEFMDFMAQIREGKNDTTRIKALKTQFGIAPDLIYQEIMANNNVGLKRAKEMIKSGELSDLLPNYILKAIQQASPGGRMENAAEKAGTTMQTYFKKITSLPSQYFQSLIDSPYWGKVKGSLDTLFEKLLPENNPQLIKALADSFGLLAKWFTDVLTVDNITRFVHALQTMGSAISVAVSWILRVNEKLNNAVMYVVNGDFLPDLLKGKKIDLLKKPSEWGEDQTAKTAEKLEASADKAGTSLESSAEKAGKRIEKSAGTLEAVQNRIQELEDKMNPESEKDQDLLRKLKNKEQALTEAHKSSGGDSDNSSSGGGNVYYSGAKIRIGEVVLNINVEKGATAEEFAHNVGEALKPQLPGLLQNALETMTYSTGS